MDAIEFFRPVALVGLVVLGLLLGSFLNVVIARLPADESLVWPGSRCPKCGHAIRWWENIPLLSWLVLRGRCSGCKQPISWRYPLVEALTGALFWAVHARFGWSRELVVFLPLVLLLVPLTFIDLEHWILPHELTWTGIGAGLLLRWLVVGQEAFFEGLAGALLAFFGFWAMEFVGAWLFKKEALGGGDKFLLALIGAFLGWQVLLGVVLLSSLQGSVVGILLLLVRGRAGPAPAPVPEPAAAPERDAAKDADPDEDDWEPGPTNIPFGPWLAAAALEVLLLGPWFAEHLPRELAAVLGARGS
jgi:leader peptidase (prepilin peptidase)/N-methyltransferase